MADTQTGSTQETPVVQDYGAVRGIVNFFNVIGRANSRVVYTTFDGEIVVDKGFKFFKGVYLNFPWRKRAVRISLINHMMDTVEKETFTLGVNGANGVKIGYDADYQIRIVDVEKFYGYAESMGNKESDNAINTKKIYDDILGLLENKVLEYIHSNTYDDLIKSSAFNLQDEINAPGPDNTASTAQYIRDTYGVEVARVTFRLTQPKAVIEEATRTKVAEQAKLTAIQTQEKLKIEEQGRADRMKIMAEAQAEQVKKVGAAEAEVIGAIDGADATRVVEAKEETKRAQAYANGTATVYAFQGGQPGMMMGMPGMMMGAPAAGGPVPQQAAPQQPAPQAAPQVDWASLPDTEYLSAEDSTQLAAERGTPLLPGARYHYSLLTAAEKTRYKVAADKGKTR